MLHLLTAVVARHLDDLEHAWTDEQRQAIAARVADSALDALVLLIRQTVAEGGVVSIGELGRISRDEGGWRFEPAAELLTAASLRRERQVALHELAQQSLFYLRQGLRLAEELREDVGIASEQPDTAEERLLKAIFGEEATDVSISSHFAQLSTRLKKVSKELGASSGVDEVKEATAVVSDYEIAEEESK